MKKEERKKEKKKKRRREKAYLDVKKEERKRKKSYPDRCEEGRKKKERKKNLKNEERKKKRKDEYVGVGGKGSVRRKIQDFFFFGITYSRVLKKQKGSNKLAIAAFLRSAAIGPPKKEVYLGSFRIFGWCYL